MHISKRILSMLLIAALMVSALVMPAFAASEKLSTRKWRETVIYSKASIQLASTSMRFAVSSMERPLSINRFTTIAKISNDLQPKNIMAEAF